MENHHACLHLLFTDLNLCWTTDEARLGGVGNGTGVSGKVSTRELILQVN